MSAHESEHDPEIAAMIENIGATVAAQRWRKKITQGQLAAAVGMSQPNLSKKLRGEVPITIQDLMRIGRVLDLDPADLLLPRLDSNQQPSGYQYPQVSGGVVVDLGAYRGTRDGGVESRLSGRANSLLSLEA